MQKPTNNIREFYFKKTFLGNVLMIKKRVLTEEIGLYEDRWVKATEKEAQDFYNELHMLKEYKKMDDYLRLHNPELYI
jgi:hypothetical protein